MPAKRKRRYKRSSAKRKNVSFMAAVSRVVLAVLVLGVVALLSYGILLFMQKADVFPVKEVTTNVYFREFSSISREMKKDTLLHIDLDKYSSFISRLHPEFKGVVLVKVFPSAVSINIEQRSPFAQIKAGRFYYMVDRDGMVISDGSVSRYDEIVELLGWIQTASVVKKGVVLSKEPIRSALLLVDGLKKAGFFSDYPNIKKIYASSVNTIRFALNGVVIHIGGPPYGKKLSLLSNVLLPKFRDSLDDLKQIDLRFSPPVIGYKR